MIFYFSGTGNSLYVAKQLDTELVSILLAIGKWSCVHPMMKVIPVEWDYAIPFGILCPPQPSKMLGRFLDAVRQTVSVS